MQRRKFLDEKVLRNRNLNENGRGDALRWCATYDCPKFVACPHAAGCTEWLDDARVTTITCGSFAESA